jgi:hypothetical protein
MADQVGSGDVEDAFAPTLNESHQFHEGNIADTGCDPANSCAGSKGRKELGIRGDLRPSLLVERRGSAGFATAGSAGA